MGALWRRASPADGSFDPTAPLTPTGNLRRRLWVSAAAQTLAVAAAVIAVAALVVLTIDVIVHGSHAISWSFLTTNAPLDSAEGGGIAAAIVGSAVIVVFGALIATPLGVLCAVWLVEFDGAQTQAGRILRTCLDMMQGLPTVVIGLFIFGLIVAPQHKDTGFAAAIAVSIIMLPLVARASQEVLLTLPDGLREASDALGVDRWRSILTVILPTASGGILTGVILAVARAAGETAPIIILDAIISSPNTNVNPFGQGIASIPLTIWDNLDASTPGALPRAWGASLVLLGMILIANIVARLILWRSRRRLGL